MDKEFSPLGGKIFPHFVSYVEGGKPVAEAEITQLDTDAPLPSSAFELPAGAVSKPSCENPTAGRKIKTVEPQYPDPKRRARVQGTVVIYAVVGADGSLHHTRIVSGVSPVLDQASLNAVQQWRYKPYTCQNTPVEVESVIQVDFHLPFTDARR